VRGRTPGRSLSDGLLKLSVHLARRVDRTVTAGANENGFQHRSYLGDCAGEENAVR
jgi:hypothetical protein